MSGPIAIDWKNIRINIKELIAAVVFTFTISGVWYKLYFVFPEEQRALKSKYDTLQKEFSDYKEKTDSRIRILEDDKTARDAIQKVVENPQNNFYPMTRLKSK